jgi:hypothetical protein
MESHDNFFVMAGHQARSAVFVQIDLAIHVFDLVTANSKGGLAKRNPPVDSFAKQHAALLRPTR